MNVDMHVNRYEHLHVCADVCVGAVCVYVYVYVYVDVYVYAYVCMLDR